MALKGEKWFFKQALTEERRRTRLTYLSARALDLGFNEVNTGGHIRQAVGATQEFLTAHPAHVATIKALDATEPLDLAASGLIGDWLAFLGSKAGTYGQRKFGYNWDTLRGYLTPALGGSRAGGGGGDHELRLVFRLMAEFV